MALDNQYARGYDDSTRDYTYAMDLRYAYTPFSITEPMIDISTDTVVVNATEIFDDLHVHSHLNVSGIFLVDHALKIECGNWHFFNSAWDDYAYIHNENAKSFHLSSPFSVAIRSSQNNHGALVWNFTDEE